MSGRRLRSLLLAAALVAGAVPAHAQSSDKAMAESLFQAGRALMKQNKPGEACPKFAESNRIDPSPGTLLNLGKCLEATGKTASAWAAYKEAIVLARSTGQSKHVTAGTELRAPSAQAVVLRIDASVSAAGMVVKRDGRSSATARRRAHRVDPVKPHRGQRAGLHHLATDRDHRRRRREEDVDVPPLEWRRRRGAGARATASADARAGPAPSASTTVEPPPIAPGSGASTLRRWASFGGRGVAGIAVATVFGGSPSASQRAEGEPVLCPESAARRTAWTR